MSLKAIAFIPARKGSKRVPGKNVRVLAGKPLIQYSIETALEAAYVDAVVVSTDDERSMEIANQFGCIVVEREKELASDTANSIDVVVHGIEALATLGVECMYLVLLQPTVPFRDPRQVDEAISILNNTGCDSVVSHIPVDYFHPNRMKKIIDGCVFPYCEVEVENVPRSMLPKAFYRDGSIYAMKASLPTRSGSIFGDDSRAIVSSPEDFVNIDTELDWHMAEYIASRRVT